MHLFSGNLAKYWLDSWRRYSLKVVCLWNLEEQIGEKEGGFKVIIWGWQASNEMSFEITYDCCLSLYL